MNKTTNLMTDKKMHTTANPFNRAIIIDNI